MMLSEEQKEQVTDLYINKKLSSREISEILNLDLIKVKHFVISNKLSVKLIKKCDYCGKEFETTNHSIKLCSEECRLAKARKGIVKNNIKWSHLTKEELYDLYITQNLSKTEIRNIIGIPETSLKRLLQKFNIVKPTNLFREMQCRISQTTHNNRSEETKQKMSLKLKEYWNNLSQEEKEKRINLLRKINSNRTDEHKRKLREANKRFYLNESKENREKRIALVRNKTIEAMNAMSPEQRESIVNKRIEGFNKRTPEQKAISTEKRRASWNKKSDEDKLAIYSKQLISRVKNGSIQKSKREEELRLFIESLGFKTKRQVFGCGKTRFELDIVILELNLAVEYNGTYFHSTNGCNKRDRNYHFDKSKIANDMNLSLIHIWEHQWQNHRPLIEDLLKCRLGLYNNEINNNYLIKEIDIKVFKSFFSDDSLNSYIKSDVMLGLYHNKMLIQVMSFNRLTEAWKLVLNCSKSFNHFTNSTSLLFSYFIENFNPNKVIFDLDWSLFSEDEYVKLGFKFDKYLKPKSFYISHKDKKDKVKITSKSNKESLIKTNKIFECYDSGFKRFIWLKK